MPSLDLGPVVGPQGEQGATGAQGIRGEQGLPGPNQVTNSTATPLTGVLTGNGSVVGVASIDEAPTADSTGFARSGGTDKAIKARMPVYGMGKNLLINAYFVGGGTGSGVFPVNQRGLSSYTSEGYSIDNWKKKSANQISGSAVLTADGITLTGESGSWCMLRQEIENYTVLLGKEVTISAYTSEGLLKKTGTLPSVLSSNYSLDLNFTVGILQLTMIVGTEYYFAIRASGTTEVTVYAVKLELGSEQTLCHNEGTAEAPVWVLNEIPDYGEELRKCQRYYFSYQIPANQAVAFPGIRGDLTAGTNVGVQLDLPVVMAKSPTIDGVAQSIRGNGANWNTGLSVTSTPLGMYANHIAVEVIASNASFPALTSGYAVLFTRLNLSAEL